MTRGIDWRSPDFAKTFDQFDRADFAQEFLRRNQSYRDQYREAQQLAGQEAHARQSQIAAHWGLVFRLRS